LYGEACEHVLPPNPASAQLSADRSFITVTLQDSTSVMSVDAEAAANFEVQVEGSVAAVARVIGGTGAFTLELSEPLPAGVGLVSDLGHSGPGAWIKDSLSGIGLLTFELLPVAPSL
jgi:hypothetical protein